MTLQERKVIEQARNALQTGLVWTEYAKDVVEIDDALTAINELLSKQEKDLDEVDIRSRLYQRIHELETQWAQPEQEKSPPEQWVEQWVERWVERWYGSTEKGWWICCGREHIAHFGAEVSGDEVRKIVDAHNRYKLPPQPKEPEQEPCPDKERDEYACKNRYQCWEPCGELGKSEEHVRVAQPEQEPVAYIKAAELEELKHCNGMSLWAENAAVHTDDSISKQLLPSGHVPVYTTPPQPKEPEQEPVAYFNPQVKGGFYWAKPTKITAPVTVNVEPMPLYTTPPQRKPLTDEQIFVIKHNWITTPFVNHLDFARAIEAAHGIKE